MRNKETFNDTETLLISCVQTVAATLSHEMHKHIERGGTADTFHLSTPSSHAMADICLTVLIKTFDASEQEILAVINLFVAVLHRYEVMAQTLTPEQIEQMKHDDPVMLNLSPNDSVPEVFSSFIEKLDEGESDAHS